LTKEIDILKAKEKRAVDAADAATAQVNNFLLECCSLLLQLQICPSILFNVNYSGNRA
jgi:hypothetical protein